MSHYYDENQESPFQPFEIPIRLQDMNLKILSAHGVFSVKKLDKGTEVLLKYCVLPEKGRVLDMGCGYGIVGLVAKLRNPDLEVIQADINERALKLARMNNKNHGIKNTVIKSDSFSNIKGFFDTILLNPPYVAGRTVVFRMIEESYGFLKNNGSLQVVARHQKGGKILSEKIKEVFGDLKILGKSAGYRVYKGTKNKKTGTQNKHKML